MTPTPLRLREVLEASFPPEATCWSQATGEVRDMSRLAREALGLDESHAVNFLDLNTPALYNSVGVMSVVVWYESMTPDQQAEYIESLRGYVPDLVERMGQKYRAEFLETAVNCGAVITGKPDGSEPITVVFTIEAWRAFDVAMQG